MSTNRGRVAIYARVSTRDQTPENQLIALRDYVRNRGWEIVEEFVDHGVSGAKEQRPQLGRMLELVRRRRCDIVLVWKFDRFARSSRHLLNTLEEFRALGVEFVSFSEAIDTTTPAGRMVFAMVASIAEFERSLIQERVLAGLQRARARGRRLGRPRVEIDVDRATALKAQGMSIRQIAREMGVTKDAVARELSRKRGRNSAPPPEGEAPGN
ncbi:MAG: recombinase family protein [Elusimicrobiota bacterium]|nr:recombinase family protein [Elusimicrobiota bacterium]